jgi:hypothetical protein
MVWAARSGSLAKGSECPGRLVLASVFCRELDEHPDNEPNDGAKQHQYACERNECHQSFEGDLAQVIDHLNACWLCLVQASQ